MSDKTVDTALSRLPRKLRELRRSFNMTQIEFAKFVGSNQSRVSRWERGDEEPGLRHFVMLCSRTNANFGELTGLVLGKPTIEI